MKNNISSIYVHIPFCRGLCTYCDFTKYLYKKEVADSYLISLKKEIESYNIQNKIKTVYIGGGTPTSLSNNQFSFLLSLLRPYTKDVEEYTIEANPESLSIEKLKIMKKYGVNRLSIGVESTDDNILKSIHRLHSFQDVKDKVLLARELGFNNISFDLILGLPDVTNDMLIEDIKNVISLNPEHLSCYSLTVHPHTIMGRDGIIPPNDDEMREKYDIINNILEKAGYIHYEISSWCKENKESKHNLVYWKDEKYYGFGVGASGFINNKRYTNTNKIKDYNDGKYILEEEIVDENDDFEYLMLALRTIYGVDFKEYKSRFGVDFLDKYLQGFINYGYDKYLIIKDDHAYLNYDGMMILDKILLDITE